MGSDGSTISDSVRGSDARDATATADKPGGPRESRGNPLPHYGFWKARFTVPAPIVKSPKAKALKRMEAENGDQVEAAMLGKDGAPLQIKSKRDWIATFEEMYQISADPVLLSIVQDDLAVPPIFNTPVSFLNSFVKPKSQRDLSDTAQLYHHDMRRLGFSKLFVYLADVAAQGPPPAA
jgi:hypothetical protein